MRQTKIDIKTIFEKNDISGYWTAFKDKLKTSIRIEYKLSNDDEIEIGKSKFGGLPDLSKTTNWAEFESIPLTFLAQINLENLPNSEIRNLLPQNGLLSFFYSSDNDDYASSPHKVIFSTISNNDFERKLQPENWNDNEIIFKTGEITDLKIEQSLPSGETEYVLEVFKNDTENRWKYWSLVEPDNSEETTNRMFGYPHNSDDRFELICECIANGDHELKQIETYTDNQKQEIREKWILLLQIDSNTDLEMYMGVDLDCFYFFISKDDLAKSDFSKTVAFSIH